MYIAEGITVRERQGGSAHARVMADERTETQPIGRDAAANAQ